MRAAGVARVRASHSRGVSSATIRPSRSSTTRSAAGRQRSSRCSASTIAVPHSSLSRRSTPSSSSPATGSSWEVGSSSSSSRGRPASEAASATRCSSPPLSSCVGRSSRPPRPSASAASSTPRATAGAAQPRFSSGNASSAAHRAHHDLRLGVLEQRPGDRGDPRRAVLARVQPARLDGPGEGPAVEVRHEPGRRAQQRRLARAGAAREQHQLARLDRQRHAGERVPVHARGSDTKPRPPSTGSDPLEGSVHRRPTPRRSANGASVQTKSAAIAIRVAAVSGADRRG